MKRVGVVLVILIVATVALTALAPLAFAAEDPAGCTTTYVGAATNPPDTADPIICEGKFCSEGIGLNPSTTGAYVNHQTTAAETYVSCVV